MNETELAWESPEALSDLTFRIDWDAVVSMILSLRIHLHEFGTIPTWNFMFCHGRPELAVPYSWAWTWPSLFAYAMPGVYAIIAVWVMMSLVGFFSARALFLRWSGSGIGATVGAGVYVLGGYFANRFNAGHITFAFFHWVPLLIYLFDVTFERALERRPIFWPLLFAILASFLFISGGLPHPLLHFYPALILFIVYRTTRTSLSLGLWSALRAAYLPIAANLLGILLAAYKLWPVIAWQGQFPRTRVRLESYSILEVISNTLIFVSDYLSSAQHQAWHVYPASGYNGFVGPVPWVCAIISIVVAFQFAMNRRSGQRNDRHTALSKGDAHGAVLFASLLVIIGIALSMGNDNPRSPAYLFRHLPILDGIRAFNRYQILIVFGLAILTARGFAGVKGWLEGRAGWTAPLTAALAVAALAPVMMQAFFGVSSIAVRSNAAIAKRLQLEPQTGPPVYVRAKKLQRFGQQATILESGNWVGNCYSNITLPGRPPRSAKRREPISYPPPERIEMLGHDRITLRYGEATPALVQVNLRMLASFDASAPMRAFRDGKGFRTADLDDGLFTLKALYPSVSQGRRASGLGLLATSLFLGTVALRERRTRTFDGSASTRPNENVG